MTARPHVVIVGGGISALAAAYELTGGPTPAGAAAPRVTILERETRLGGKLGSTEIHGRLVDAAADGVLARRPEARALVEGSGLERISVLRGGISEWERTGAPLNRGAGGRWAMERQVRLVAGSIVLASVAASAVFGPLKWVAAAVGAGLTFAAVTDSCLMARLLALLPYNRADSCDAPAMLTALTDAAPAARD